MLKVLIKEKKISSVCHKVKLIWLIRCSWCPGMLIQFDWSVGGDVIQSLSDLESEHSTSYHGDVPRIWLEICSVVLSDHQCYIMNPDKKIRWVCWSSFLFRPRVTNRTSCDCKTSCYKNWEVIQCFFLGAAPRSAHRMTELQGTAAWLFF